MCHFVRMYAAPSAPTSEVESTMKPVMPGYHRMDPKRQEKDAAYSNDKLGIALLNRLAAFGRKHATATYVEGPGGYEGMEFRQVEYTVGWSVHMDTIET